MIKKSVILFLCVLHYYQNKAFYTPYFHKKPNKYFTPVLQSINNFEKNDDDATNKNIRLGRTKDEDGKSNIWSVEPKMEVIKEEITETNKNILICGLIITGFLASLPVLYTISQYVEKMDY